MGISLLRATGRLLTPVVAFALLAGVSLEAGAYGDKGTIFFETGKTLTNFRFVYAPKDGDDEGAQTFAQGKGCTTRLDPDSAAKYVVLEGFRSTTTAPLGYMATSIGVYDGPQGTACGRVSEPKSEALTLSLVGNLPNEANAFDRLELDLEVKGDVVLRLDVKFDQSVVSYYLESGAGVAPPGVDASKVWNCRLTSDSGPDSGPSDNCRWEVDAFGKSFTITPLRGEFSFEGGGDFAEVRPNSTKIFLTKIDGVFGCADTIDSSDATMSCSVTRLDPSGGTQACTPVPYIFRTGGGTCTLTVDPLGQQLVANLLVSYNPEPATGTTLDTGSWQASPLSQVKFATSSTTFKIPACRGFTIDDGSDPSPLSPTPTDWVPGGQIEFACAFQRLEVFETNSNTGVLETWITEGIQFWGDISFSRGGSN